MRPAMLSRLSIGMMLVLIAAGQTLAAGAGRSARLVLKGYDPVAYFTETRPMKDSPEISHDFDGARYLFASAKHRDLSASNPERYLPQFDGLCTTGLSMGKNAYADPAGWKIVDGKLCVFFSPAAKDKGELDPALIAKAQKAFQAQK